MNFSGSRGASLKVQDDSVGETELVLELDQTERAGQPGLSSGLTSYYLHEVGHNGYCLDFRVLLFKWGLKIGLVSIEGL